jgi:tetratricopeptide (TPR) repeat protein
MASGKIVDVDVDRAASNGASEWLEGPFVGRAAALAAALEAVQGGFAGRARVVLVSGEPGVGKSRLAREVTARIPHRAVWSSCWEGDGAPPFWPWLQVLRALRAEGVESGRVRGDHGSLGELLGLRADDDAQAARFRLFDAFADIAAEATASGPLLLVIDDLQWADSGSLRLLRFLCSDVRGDGLAVIATCREDSASRMAGEIADPVGELAPGCLHVRLGGLVEAEVAQLCEQLGAGDVDATALHRRSGGNPFYVREFVRLGARAAESVPASVDAVVALRLDAIPVAARETLVGAAVLGATFDVATVGELLDRDPADVLDALEDAHGAGLVTTAGPARFGFVHAVVQEVLYARLRGSDRTRLHARAALVVERRTSGRAVVDIAHHHLHAALGVDPQAAVSAERAAEWSYRTCAYEQAADWYRHALRLMPPGTDPAREAELLVRLGDAALAAGDMADARDSFRRAAAAARECASAELLARAALGWGSGQGGFEVPLHDSTQVALLEEALAAVGPSASGLRARLLSRLSVALSAGDQEHRRIELSEDAIAAAREVGDLAALGHALAAHSDATAGPDYSEARRDEAGEIVELARRSMDRPLELLGRRLRAVASLELGDIAGFDADVARFSELADELRQPLYSWYVPLWRGLRLLMLAAFDDAAAATDAARDLGRRAQSANAVALTLTQWWVAERLQGRFIEAATEMRAVLGLESGATPMVFGDAEHRLRAVIAAQLGDRAAAYAQLDLLLAGGHERRPIDSEWLPDVAQLAQVAVLADHAEAAAVLYDQLSPYAHRYCIEGIGAAFTGSVHWYLALLANAMGNGEEAANHETAARRAHRRVGLVGDPPRLAPAATPPVVESFADAPALRAALIDEGATWAITFAGTTRRLRDSKGMRDLAILLGRPQREVHCLELAAGADVGGDVGPALDESARRAYQQRIQDLQEDIDDARTAGDLVRAERAEGELDALVEQLSQAFGLSGRARVRGSAAERARTTVTSRVRAAIRRAAAVHPDLGRHLQHSVHTGTWCRYAPEHPCDWQIETRR